MITGYGSTFKPGQIFNPETYTGVQAGALANTPGQSLSKTNTPAGIITAQSLTPTTPFPLVTPKVNPAYNVAGLMTPTPPLQLTPEEQAQSDQIQAQEDLNNQMIGRSAYQTEQDTKFGVDAAQGNISDLTAQLTALKNEANAIPLDLQNNSTGITTGVLNTMTDAALRTNAIKALSVSTLLAASQGQLANAQAMADKAVEQKYQPIQERIDANKANLQLIIDDPKTTLADKNRAIAQQDIQDAKTSKIAQQKDDASQIQKWAIEAISNGASPQVAQSLIDLAHSDNPDIAKALQIYSPYATGGTDKILGSATKGYYTYDPATGQTTPISNPNVSSPGNTPVSPTPKSTPNSGYKFTATQLNNGSANAGKTSEEFKALPGEVQNFYVNSKTLATQFNEALVTVKSGESDAQTIINNINSMTIPQTVKDYLTQQVQSNTPAKKDSGFKWYNPLTWF